MLLASQTALWYSRCSVNISCVEESSNFYVFSRYVVCGFRTQPGPTCSRGRLHFSLQCKGLNLGPLYLDTSPVLLKCILRQSLAKSLNCVGWAPASASQCPGIPAHGSGHLSTAAQVLHKSCGPAATASPPRHGGSFVPSLWAQWWSPVPFFPSSSHGRSPVSYFNFKTCH